MLFFLPHQHLGIVRTILAIVSLHSLQMIYPLQSSCSLDLILLLQVLARVLGLRLRVCCGESSHSFEITYIALEGRGLNSVLDKNKKKSQGVWFSQEKMSRTKFQVYYSMNRKTNLLKKNSLLSNSIKKILSQRCTPNANWKKWWNSQTKRGVRGKLVLKSNQT